LFPYIGKIIWVKTRRKGKPAKAKVLPEAMVLAAPAELTAMAVRQAELV
jgi:hypothetical protein